MWFDDFDIGVRGLVLPAQGPFGRVLRAARYDALLSQEQLAELAGVSQSSISRIERGQGSWTLFVKLMEVIGGRPVVAVESAPRDAEDSDGGVAVKWQSVWSEYWD